MSGRAAALRRIEGIEKAPTGVAGLDQVTGGGLPRGRTTLVCGGAGSGKTLLGMEFLVRGATHLKWNGRGKIAWHRDYWDTAEELYAKVPLLGALMRLLRRRLAAR